MKLDIEPVAPHSAGTRFALFLPPIKLPREVTMAGLMRVGRVSLEGCNLGVRRVLVRPRRVFSSGNAGDAAAPKTSWWSSAEWWGAAGAVAGWGMSGAAIYDASTKGALGLRVPVEWFVPNHPC